LFLILTLKIPNPAGKVHGSLARAGKVRVCLWDCCLVCLEWKLSTLGPQLLNLALILFGAPQVRGQTPKVAPQDKKKTPKGRAKKRILYNRRFVNVGKLPGAFYAQLIGEAV